MRNSRLKGLGYYVSPEMVQYRKDNPGKTDEDYFSETGASPGDALRIDLPPGTKIAPSGSGIFPALNPTKNIPGVAATLKPSDIQPLLDEQMSSLVERPENVIIIEDDIAPVIVDNAVKFATELTEKPTATPVSTPKYSALPSSGSLEQYVYDETSTDTGGMSLSLNEDTHMNPNFTKKASMVSTPTLILIGLSILGLFGFGNSENNSENEENNSRNLGRVRKRPLLGRLSR